MRDLGVTFDQFPNFDDHITAICRSTYFILEILEKLGIFYRIMLVLLLFRLVDHTRDDRTPPLAMGYVSG